jgi:mono/diheme cytochrome c family protein
MRKKMLVFAITSLATAWAVAAVAGHEAGALRQAPSGRDVYVNKGCHYCHGYEGQGALPTGPRLAPEPLPMDVFSNIVRRPPNVMPAYPEEVLSDEDLEQIHEYLESIPEPPDVTSIPALAETAEP